MPRTINQSPSEAVAASAHVLHGTPDDFDAVLEMTSHAHVVLIGEATHGTHEFYRIRGEITKRLITEQGYAAVAVEADWPDAYRINRFVRASESVDDAIDSLSGFQRFPQWMWRNADVLDFVGWLRAFNNALPANAPRVGFYGLDLYSLHASIDAVLAYLRIVDPEAERRARQRYSCFDYAPGDPAAYGYAATMGMTASCEAAVVAQLVELRQSAARYAARDGRVAANDLFFAEQNARLVKNAEEYYRTMIRGHIESWNLRDRHMVETLEALRLHLAATAGRRDPKIVIWAHNSHVGDARATEMGRMGEWNVGQLVRERHGSDSCAIGFTTYTGTVTAASDWNAPAERKHVRPALAGSYEALFHETGILKFLLDLRHDRNVADLLAEPRLERAIGVIYRPDTERQSHYFETVLPEQFDAVLHFDATRAVEPLERTPLWERGEWPETYPSAL